MKIQITLFHKDKKYKPIATTIDADSLEDFKQNQTEYVRKAITKIAIQRYQTPKDLTNAGYTLYKYRIYNKKERFINYMSKGKETT